MSGDGATDRDSLYLDTLSFKSGSSNYYRKSLTLSTRTIYHSTEDITDNLSLKDGVGNGLHYLDVEHSDDDSVETPTTKQSLSLSNAEVSFVTTDKDEVSTLLPNHNNSLNKKRKEIVTYNEWKSRVIEDCV